MDVTQHPHRGNSVFVEGRDAFQIDVCLWNSTRFHFFFVIVGIQLAAMCSFKCSG